MTKRETGLTKFVGFGEVAEALGRSRRTIERMVRADEFPQPVQLSKGTVGWPVDVVEVWLEGRRKDSFAKLAKSAVTNPSDLAPEAAYNQGMTQAAAAVEKLTGQRPDGVAFLRQLTDAERDEATAASFQQAQMWRGVFSSFTKEEAIIAACCEFSSLTSDDGMRAIARKLGAELPQPDDWATRQELYAEMLRRAVERLAKKSLPGLPQGKRRAG